MLPATLAIVPPRCHRFPSLGGDQTFPVGSPMCRLLDCSLKPMLHWPEPTTLLREHRESWHHHSIRLLMNLSCGRAKIVGPTTTAVVHCCANHHWPLLLSVGLMCWDGLNQEFHSCHRLQADVWKFLCFRFGSMYGMKLRLLLN